MNRQVVVRTIPELKERDIVISDIHGDMDGYLQILDKCCYRPNQDRLILLGDMMEKGTQNLALLRHIMKQCEEENVLCLMGNCDFIAKNFLFSYRLEFIRKVLLERPHSLIKEMMAELGLPEFDEHTDMEQLAHTLRTHYLKELVFLNDLPHVLQNSHFIFVHAGLLDERDFAPDFRYVLTYPFFARSGGPYEKTVIAGHLPVSEYAVQRADFNPRYSHDKNILSIDGGNVIKRAGQLNALILTPSLWTHQSTDHLPQVKVRHTTRPYNLNPIYINWNEGELDVLESKEETSLVYSKALNRTFEIDNTFLKDGRGCDFTTYEMPVHAGENVRLVRTYHDKAQIKKDGILGWTLQENLDPASLEAAQKTLAKQAGD